ncbi:hypothetical protein CPB83DRAFT_283059 [Crepidotus variabilis]|uniref:Uncharacterized protein n=1 Tax=Crepidotus variabilis TaxID=179855 RepID=A0A9P6JQD5_9AGAR|nr:hypothetical protein CPB83DRAFT_283059 [Crepidotus variabilis]
MNQYPALSSIPLELFAAIIDALGDTKTSDNCKSLMACSLVCHYFLPLCQRHIFRTVVVNQNQRSDIFTPTASSLSFAQVISKSPILATYIKKLVYCITASDLNHALADKVAAALQQIDSLQSLVLNCYVLQGPSSDDEELNGRRPIAEFERRLVWDELPLRPSFRRLLQLPTTRGLTVANKIVGFSLQDLGPAVKSLSLGKATSDLSLDGFDYAGPPPAITELLVYDIQTAETLVVGKRSDGHPLLFFTDVKKFAFVWCQSSRSVELCRKLVSKMETLRNFDTLVFSNFSLKGLAEGLAPANIAKTLKHLAVSLYILGSEGETPFKALSEELKEMKGNNVLLTIAITITIPDNCTCATGQVWNRFDEILTSSGSWPCLKKVRIEFRISRKWRQLGDFDRDLANLTSTHMRKLTSSSSVDLKLKCTDRHD